MIKRALLHLLGMPLLWYWVPACLFAQERPLQQAHAHNDYLHQRPLFDALDQGFCSVEADVFLVKGQLYLGHIKPRKSTKRTLAYRYLEPLNARLARNGGTVYPNFDGVFYLMIDFKSEGKASHAVLDSLLQQYPQLQHNPHFVVFCSGNRPLTAMLADQDRIAAVDGRPSDLGKGYASEFMPVISDSYKKYFQWNGVGVMPLAEFESLRQMADMAHQEGKKFRLWAIPDRPEAWRTLLDAGVDFINTDKLKSLSFYMNDH
ncbi:MAG: hypothetical protein IPL65_10360 [Lewinellaceae bacterium]|nr:hypothetical protein [Lewinellaceae bacterium]